MKRGRLPPCVAAAALLLVACGGDDGNFSQYPGFAEWYAAHPPSEQLPTAAEQALLERYRPRVFLPAGNEGPIDFYRDYVAQGQLFDGAGRLISAAVGPELLNAHKRDPKVVFVHTPSGVAPRPVIYGRIDRADLEPPGCATPLPVTFLTYNLVSRHSGLPAGLPGWQTVLLELVADLEDWHQLDQYTALTLALAAPEAKKDAKKDGKKDGEDLAPFAVTFQQHNYQRSYVLADRDGPGSLVLPPDGRIGIDVAERSNELYPHRTGPVRRRAVAFMSPKTARYLVEGLDAPWLAADDITLPVREIQPELRLPGLARRAPAAAGPRRPARRRLQHFAGVQVQGDPAGARLLDRGRPGLPGAAGPAVRRRPPARGGAGTVRRPPRPRSQRIAGAGRLRGVGHGMIPVVPPAAAA
jgi:hypothetical protein